jgi:muramoyltetrapeptide carboxypeptidase
MVATDLAKGLSEHARRALRGSSWRTGLALAEPIPDVVGPGHATGRLVGVGVCPRWWPSRARRTPSRRGAVLFLEDVAERPYRLDRMLTHLRLAGKLSGVAAVVLGSFADCDGRRRR